MLIVQGLDLPNEGYTSIKPWLNLVLQKTKTLDSMLVVFLIDYCAYDGQQFPNKTNVRHISNWDLDDSIKNRILWYKENMILFFY